MALLAMTCANAVTSGRLPETLLERESPRPDCHACALGSWSFIVLHGCLWAYRGLVAAQQAQNRNPSSLCQGEGRQFESGRPLLAKRAWDLQLSHLRGQLLMRSVS